jgi:cell division protein FtsB
MAVKRIFSFILILILGIGLASSTVPVAANEGEVWATLLSYKNDIEKLAAAHIALKARVNTLESRINELESHQKKF